MLHDIIFTYFLIGISLGISFAMFTATDYLIVRSVWNDSAPIIHYYKDNILGPLEWILFWKDVNFFGKLFPFIIMLPMYPFYFISYSIIFLIFLLPFLYKWIFRVREK